MGQALIGDVIGIGRGHLLPLKSELEQVTTFNWIEKTLIFNLDFIASKNVFSS